MSEQDYLNLSKALSLLHDLIDEDNREQLKILTLGEDVLRDYENKGETK